MQHAFSLSFLGLLLSLLFAPAVLLHGQETKQAVHTNAEVDYLLQQIQQSHSAKDSGLLAKQGLDLARTLRYDDGVVRSSIILGEVNARAYKNEEALQNYLEAESKASAAKSKQVLIQIYSALGDLFFREKMFYHARRYYGEVLKIQPQDYATMEKSADAALADAALLDSAQAQTRIDSATAYYKVLTAKFQKEGNDAKLVQIYQKVAQAYDKIGNSKQSLDNYERIAKLIEPLENYREEATLYNNMGRQHTARKAYGEALRYFRLAEDRCAYVQCNYFDLLWTNIGIALYNTGNPQLGIDYMQKARAVLVARKDSVSLANLEHLIAGVYFNSNDTYNALAHNDIAIQLAQQTKQWSLLVHAYETAADIYQDLYDFENAIRYYREYLQLQNKVRVEEEARQRRLGQQRGQLAAAEGQIKYLIAQQSYRDLELQAVKVNEERLMLANDTLALRARQSKDQALLLVKQKEVDQSKIKAQELEALRARQELRLSAQSLSAEKQERLNTDLRRQVEMDRTRSVADSARNAQRMEILRRDKDIADLRIREQERLQKFGYWLGALFLLILLLLGIGFILARRAGRRLRKQNYKIQAQNVEIQEERRKSDRLLTNILPEEIADELKAYGSALPRMYDSVTVVFTDFVNFTRLSALLSPEEIIDELNECFLAFDEICDQRGLEKIKTIGDAFMCAGGLPLPNETHAYDAVCAALDMVAWLERRNQENPRAHLRDMRIGIHTGPVVAGVIGKNKFAFDIWGDAVNLAARLEEHGMAGQVNVSKATAEAVKEHFKIIYRGQEEVHNKGWVDMYFVEPFSTDLTEEASLPGR